MTSMPKNVLSVIGLIFSLVGFDATAEQLSFSDAYEIARQQAPDLGLARYRVDGAGAQKDIAMGRILPQVRLFGDFSNNEVDYSESEFYPAQNYPGVRYGVQVRQVLLNVSAGLEAVRRDLLYDQARSELVVAEHLLLNELVEAYLNVLLADEDLTRYRSEAEALEGQVMEAEKLFEKSLIPLTQLLETMARKDSVRADLVSAEGNVAASREQLIKLIGKRNIDLMPVNDTLALLPTQSSAAEAARQAIESSPAVAAAKAAVEAAEKGVDRERAVWIPELDLTYSYQHSDVGFDNLRSPARDTSTIAVGFSYPLFEGGAGNARLRGAKAELGAAKLRLIAEERESEADARSAWLNLKSHTERLVAARQAVVSSQTNVTATRKAMRAGSARMSEVLLALAQETKASRDLSLAKFQFAMGWVALELATGSTPSDVAKTLSEALHGE